MPRGNAAELLQLRVVLLIGRNSRIHKTGTNPNWSRPFAVSFRVRTGGMARPDHPSTSLTHALGHGSSHLPAPAIPPPIHDAHTSPPCASRSRPRTTPASSGEDRGARSRRRVRRPPPPSQLAHSSPRAAPPPPACGITPEPLGKRLLDRERTAVRESRMRVRRHLARASPNAGDSVERRRGYFCFALTPGGSWLTTAFRRADTPRPLESGGRRAAPDDLLRAFHLLLHPYAEFPGGTFCKGGACAEPRLIRLQAHQART